MEFSLDDRTAQLSVGEFADFAIGPRDSAGGPQGLWRAQLGTHWHQQLRIQLTTQRSDAQFEVSLSGQVFHRGWVLTLGGRIDQLFVDETGTCLREIKTVTRDLPADEEELMAEYPAYFAQLATYLALRRQAEPGTRFRGELVFVEAGSGLSQSVSVPMHEDRWYRVQLERIVEFLNLRLSARERLEQLNFQPAFAELRPGQETIQGELEAASTERSIIFFEAPTGFGKTGAMLEFALKQLRAGKVERVLYLTSKSTGQLQVVRQLQRMTALPRSDNSITNGERKHGVAVWHVRNKGEHCVNHTFHCVRDSCRFLVDLERRWPQSGLARFYLHENESRDVGALREAGRNALICPYEITRAALAFNDVWIGDYNYVFSPSSQGLFSEQPGFDPARTLLIVDEAHNLPSRVADAYSHVFSASDAAAVSEMLHRIRPNARLLTAWDEWAHFLRHRSATDALDLADEDDARDLLTTLGQLISTTPFDQTSMGPHLSALLWNIPAMVHELASHALPRLWWSPVTGQLSVTCLDAARAIGPTLRAYRNVILASATLGPKDFISAACGLEGSEEIRLPSKAELPARLGGLTKRETIKLSGLLTVGSSLLRVEKERVANEPALLRAATPWRDTAYDVAYDLRVDTSYQQRARYFPATAKTLEEIHEAARNHRVATGESLGSRAIAAFFPSYRYAEAIQEALRSSGSPLRIALQPRLPDLDAQIAWVEESLLLADALFLVLGSSFAEGIDLLGGRVTHAMIVGPALPEVNAVQRARGEVYSRKNREEVFRRIYQIPGIQKVNQALGRLVRAPGQHAKVLLHCRRFAETSYSNLLAPEYQAGTILRGSDDFRSWLEKP